MGIISAITFSLKTKLLSKKNYLKIKNHYFKFNLPNKINDYFSIKDIKKIVLLMKKDKKNTNNFINLILLKNIGKVKLNLIFKDKKIYNFFKNQLINI